MEILKEYWLTAGVGLFLTAMVLYGHYRGFLRIAISLSSFLLALVLTQAAIPHVTAFLEEKTNISQIVTENMDVVSQSSLSAEELQLPDVQRRMIEDLKLPAQLKEALLENNNHEVYTRLGVEAFIDYVSTYLARAVINLVAAIILYAVFLIAIRLLMRWIDLIARLPILHGINQIAGAVLGGIQGLLAVWLFFLAATIASSSTWGNAVLTQIQGSGLLRFLYSRNIFSLLIHSVLQIVS